MTLTPYYDLTTCGKTRSAILVATKEHLFPFSLPNAKPWFGDRKARGVDERRLKVTSVGILAANHLDMLVTEPSTVREWRCQ